MKLSTLLLIVGSLLAVVAVVVWDWTVFGAIGIDLPAIGWIALGLGVVVTIAVGCGLMFLIFWSSRRGYDDAVGREDGDAGVEEWKRQD
jgi:hypothetical protein